MKSTVPVRHRRRDPARRSRERGKDGLQLRVLPRVPQGGLGASRTSCSPTASSSATTATGPATRSSSCYAPLERAARAHRRRQRRDGQARLQRVPGDEDLVHQRDRQRLRGDRRRRASRSRGGWASTSASARKFLQAGIGFGGSCFPKDVDALKQLAGNSGYHFQLLNAVIEVNELQKRRVIGKLQKHLGVARRQAGRAARARVQAEHRRHARGLLARAGRAPAGRRRAACAPTTRSPRSEARKLMRRRRASPTRALEALDGADAVVLVTEWPRVHRARLGARSPRRCAGSVVIDGRNALDREAVRAAGLLYEGIGRGDRARTAPSEAD